MFNIFIFYSFLVCFLLCNCKQYILYDVTYTEGFNLRRDVYIRMINFVRSLNSKENWTIILPPWSYVYHWKINTDINWKDFFDLNSMQTVHSIMEFHEFSKVLKRNTFVNVSFLLKNHPNTNFGDFSSRADVVKCSQFEEKKTIFNSLSVDKNICLNIRMDIADFAEYFDEFLKNHTDIQLVYIHDFEKIIHGKYSEWSEEYWTVRRSMVFSSKLRSIGDKFREKYLNSIDIADRTVFPNDWRVNYWPLSPAKGGPYIGAHIRRGDFIRGREESYPTVDEIIYQLSKMCELYNLNTVFIATDTTINEKEVFKFKASNVNITVLYFPNQIFHPGEIAIIDQWIASHARAFVGTFQSTFTFRIFEERQIMGFVPSTTHNVFCPSRLKNLNQDEDCCSKPTVWPVKFEPKFTVKGNTKTEL